MPAPQPLALRAQRVSLAIDSGAVQAQVTQVFNNPTSTPLEGTYLFNLPEGATVANFRMQVDKEPVDGKVVAVDEARRIYEQFVRQRIDPGILEYVGRNVFRARVFPNSRLKGQANILVLPDLDAANIAFNLVKVVADGLAVGPILIGVAQPAHILTPSVTVRGIVNMTAVAVVEAQGRRDGWMDARSEAPAQQGVRR